MDELTNREAEVLQAIRLYIRHNDRTPQNIDIARMMNMHRAAVHFHVRNLERKKYLKRLKGRGWKKIELTK